MTCGPIMPLGNPLCLLGVLIRRAMWAIIDANKGEKECRTGERRLQKQKAVQPLATASPKLPIRLVGLKKQPVGRPGTKAGIAHSPQIPLLPQMATLSIEVEHADGAVRKTIPPA